MKIKKRETFRSSKGFEDRLVAKSEFTTLHHKRQSIVDALMRLLLQKNK